MTETSSALDADEATPADDHELVEAWRADVLDRLTQSRTVAEMALDRGLAPAGGWIAACDAAFDLVRFG